MDTELVEITLNYKGEDYQVICDKETANILLNANEVTCSEQDGHISYHADKNDCKMYWMCEGERKHHMPCPANLVFNQDQNVCDWPENVESCSQFTPAPPTDR